MKHFTHKNKQTPYSIFSSLASSNGSSLYCEKSFLIGKKLIIFFILLASGGKTLLPMICLYSTLYNSKMLRDAIGYLAVCSWNEFSLPGFLKDCVSIY